MISKLFLIFSFSDYFLEKQIDCFSRYETPAANYYLADCYFKSITFSGNGGVMKYVIVNVHLVVEFCVFEACSSTSHGGAIIF